MAEMVIGALLFRLAVFESRSLKDKRRVVKSLIERLRNRYHVSVAEVGSLDHRQQADVAVAMVGNDGSFVESCLDKVVDYVRRDRSASLVDYEVELFRS